MTHEDISNLDHDTLVGIVERLIEQNKQLDRMKKWLDEQSLVALPQSSFGKAINYNLNNWRAQ